MTELKEVVKLSPKDQLSAQLLAALTQKDPADVKPTLPAAPAVPATPAVPPKPVSATSLIGSWTASRSDGSSFALDVAKDGTYSWRFTQEGKTQTFSGAYTVADNLLILKEDNAPKMIGQIVMSGDNQFIFKLAGNNPNDPGLTFSKK